MIVKVDLQPARPVVTLEDPDDCGRFHVLVAGGRDRKRVFGALIDAAAGALHEDHAWITIDALRRMAKGRVGDDWDTRFDGMISYATSKGWVDDTGNMLRAHIEYEQGAEPGDAGRRVDVSDAAGGSAGPQWKVGDVTITRVLEVMLTAVPTDLLPAATPEALARHEGWMRPWALDADGRFPLSIHALCVEADGRKIVVDTCFGPGPLPGRMAAMANDGSFLVALADAGFGRDDVDLVICTHLHVDHVGWNTMLEDGRRVPTFPNARYVLARPEYEHWVAVPEEVRSTRAVVMFDQSVTTLIEHGVVDLVEPDAVVSDTIRLVPTHGHSPGHVSVLVTSQGERALITGDCTHSPVQFAEPDWFTSVDFDTDMSSATRHELVAEFADSGVLVVGTHFPPPTAGHLVTAEAGVQFIPLA